MWPFDAMAAAIYTQQASSTPKPVERDVLKVAVARLDSVTRRLECKRCETTWMEKPYRACWSCGDWSDVIAQ